LDSLFEFIGLGEGPVVDKLKEALGEAVKKAGGTCGL